MVTQSNLEHLRRIAKHIRHAVTAYNDMLAIGGDRDALHAAVWGDDGNGLPTLREIEAFGKQCAHVANAAGQRTREAGTLDRVVGQEVTP